YLHTEGERRFIRQLFGRYVNDKVIDAIMLLPRDDVLKGHRQHVCVLFIDIRGFTTYSESRPPNQIVDFLNRYFESLTEIIMRHNGVVDKFLGDGLMAFFNAPIPRPSFLEDAVAAVLEIRETLAARKIRTTDDAFDLKVGMALHTGDAVIGNIGSERKMEFTAIGDTVNTTSRLESLNKDYGTDIIVSDSVVIGTNKTYEWKFLADHQIRGKERPVPIYTLVGKKLYG
ncbi:MAG TPA: adenylate/guanylate cyclase domain-containing protein, partial [Candidatus Ozemobacteraceae bacterium]|nr:adenylate/guanylate cyclase domain-containing protein [Candidatus Ozemobacteraceae bacterium]